MPNVILDQYLHPATEEGWPRWMDRIIEETPFVLMISPRPTAAASWAERGPVGPRGAWEGSLIYNRIYHDKPSGSRFIPILLLPGSEPAHIPNPVQGHAYYRITTFDLTDPGFEALYRHLTGQPPTPPPDLGPITTLPPKPRRGPPRTLANPLGGRRGFVGGVVVEHPREWLTRLACRCHHDLALRHLHPPRFPRPYLPNVGHGGRT